jgi:hypothetical protein
VVAFAVDEALGMVDEVVTRRALESAAAPTLPDGLAFDDGSGYDDSDAVTPPIPDWLVKAA